MDLGSPIIPKSITELDFKLDFEFQKDKDYTNVVKTIKRIKIPSNVTTLSISIDNMENNELETLLLSIIETDLQQSKKKRKTNNTKKNSKQDIQDYFIPSTVTKLVVPWVSKDMSQHIPPTVQHIVFYIQKDTFNIPETVSHLEIISKYIESQKVDFYKKLPKKLKSLTTGDVFNVIKVPKMNFRINPERLEDVVEKSMKGTIQPCLDKENIYVCQDEQPPSTTKVLFYLDNYSFDCEIPIGVKNIYYTSERKQEKVIEFPNTIEYLMIYIYSPYMEKYDFVISKFVLPTSLKYLAITGPFKYEINFSSYIPNQVTHLEICLNQFLHLIGFIPKSVKYLKINKPRSREGFKMNIVIKVPSSLIHVQLDKDIQQHIEIVPENEYYIDKSHDHSPSSITKLDLSNHNQYITPYSLPINLEEITLGPGFKQPVVKGLFPPTLKQIKFNQISLNQFKEINFQFIPTHLSLLQCKFGHCDSKSSSIKGFIQDLFHNATIGEVEFVEFLSEDTIEVIKIKNLEFYPSQQSDIKTKVDIVDIIFPSFSYSSGIEPSDIMDYKITKVKFDHTTYDKKSFYKILPPTTKILEVPLLENIDVSMLPKGLTYLKICYDTNEKLLTKQEPNQQIKSNLVNNMNFTEPLKQHDDLFFFVWKNSFIRNNVIDHLINPSRSSLMEIAIRPPTDTVVAKSHSELMKLDLSKTKKIVFDPLTFFEWRGYGDLKTWESCGSKYHFYAKDQPIPNDTTHILWEFNEIIPANLLPESCISISFTDYYKQPIPPNVLNENIIEIRFCDSFDLKLNAITFPPKLKYLTLSSTYDQYPLEGSLLPKTLKHLTIKDLSSDSPLFKSLKDLPDHIDHLFLLGQRDIKKMDLSHLPASIKYIKIQNGNEYQYQTETINITVPPTVHCVTVASKKIKYNVTIQKKVTSVGNTRLTETKIQGLDPSIKIHLVSKKFLYPKSNVFENNSIKAITYEPRQSLIASCLPNSLEYLEYDTHYDRDILPNVLPHNLITLKFGREFNKSLTPGSLPPNLKTLILGQRYNQPIPVGVLPIGLEELVFGDEFKQQLSKETLPPSLKKLTIPFWDNDIFDCIPPSVTELQFKYSYGVFLELPIDKVPSSITKLTIDDMISIQSTSLIPSNIKEIKIGGCKQYNQIPPTIESLSLSKDFADYPIEVLLNNN